MKCEGIKFFQISKLYALFQIKAWVQKVNIVIFKKRNKTYYFHCFFEFKKSLKIFLNQLDNSFYLKITLQNLLRVLKAMCLPNISLQLTAIWMFYLFGLKTSRKKPASDLLWNGCPVMWSMGRLQLSRRKSMYRPLYNLSHLFLIKLFILFLTFYL